MGGSNSTYRHSLEMALTRAFVGVDGIALGVSEIISLYSLYPMVFFTRIRTKYCAPCDKVST